MKVAITRANVVPGELDEWLSQHRENLQSLEDILYGNRAKLQVGEKMAHTIESRMSSLELGLGESTYGPTQTHRRTLEIVSTDLKQITSDLDKLRTEAADIGEELVQAGAPWIEGN